MPQMTAWSKWTIHAALTGALLALAGCGDLSEKDTGLIARPSEPALAVAFAKIELGYGHTGGLTSDGRAHCMGDNQDGQLGSTAPMERCKSSEYPCSESLLAVDGGLTFAPLGLAE
jgi:hypothetical protein